MRVTEQMRQRQTVKYTQQLNQRQSEAAGQIATGLRLDRPSQDAPAWSAATRHKQAAEKMDGYRSTGENLEHGLELTDQVLNQLHSTMTRARELSMEFSSGLHDQSLLDQGALDVRSLMRSVQEVANTQFNGAYVFGGHNEDTPPLDQNFNFQGSAQLRETEIAPGTTVKQADGAKLFSGAAGAAAVLDRLASALEQGRIQDARALQVDIDSVLDRTSEVQYRAGSDINTIRHARSVFDTVKETLVKDTETLVGSDMVQSITSFEQARQSLSAVAEISARARQMDTFLKF